MLIFEAQREARGQTRGLLVLFAMAVLLLVLAINAALTLAWWLICRSFWPGPFWLPNYFLEVNTAVTLLYVLGGWWVETSRLVHDGGVLLAEQVGARSAEASGPFAEQRFANVVLEMAVAAGMRPPRAMVLARDDSINALATGWDQRHAVVAVTAGALEHLTREELQGLVAHELSHIREGDTRLNMRLVGMVFGLETLYRLGQDLFHGVGQGRRTVLSFLGLALMCAGWLGWAAGHALQAAVSRQREYLADARSVQWTRSRDGIGGVLRKILRQQRDGVQGRRIDSMVQHMLLVGSEPGAVVGWFDSHPPLHQRIRRIYGRAMGPLALDHGREPPPSLPGQPQATPVPEDAVRGSWTLT